jgi:cell division protein FtsL
MAVTAVPGARGWLPEPRSRGWGSGAGKTVGRRPRVRELPVTRPQIPASSPRTAARPKELRNTVALLVAILLISVISLLYMNQAGRLATSGYQISDLQRQRDQLQRENEALEVELSHLRSLPYVQDVASNKLHMSKSDLAQVQYVNLDQRQLQAASTPDGLDGGP